MKYLTKLLGFTLAIGFPFAWAEQPADRTTTTASAQGAATSRADNTEMNVRDKSGTMPTPQNQTNRVDDRKLLAAVRRAVVHDKSLSTSAHNVKIVARDGVVTLRGPVRNEGEKSKIERLAGHTAGVTSVENELDIKTK